MSDLKNQKIIIATGGTGGHIFPARVLAEELSGRGCKVKIFANKNYKNYTFVNDEFGHNIISSSQIGKSFIFSFIAGIKISFGILQAFFQMLFFRPTFVIAFGGYATFPTLCAATILRKNIILHEQNAHLGKINRIFAKFAKKIFLTYRNTDGLEKIFNKKSFTVGNLVRKDIAKLSKVKYYLPSDKKFAKNDKNMGYNLLLKSDFDLQKRKVDSFFNILIIGGSGGAKIFSDIMPKAIFNLRSEIKQNILISQQCRIDLLDSTLKQYKLFKINTVIGSFFGDMEEKIKNAHLIISRAGSSTISESTIAKKPLILIPLVNSSDNHQLKNAKEIIKKGSAIMIEEKDFTINKISNLITKLIDNTDMLIEMSEKSHKSAAKNVADKMIKRIFENQ